MSAVLALLFASAASAQEPARLAERFSRAAVLRSSSTDEERALFEAASRALLAAETGRSLAEELLQDPAPVEVRFDDLPGIGGRAETGAGQDRVALSRTLLTWKPEWAVIETARTLAHELLGHVLSHRRARAAGVDWEFGSSFADEENAFLIGALVELEAGWRFPDPNAEVLVTDHAAFVASQQAAQPSYAAMLTDTELSTAKAAYEARLEGQKDRPAFRSAVEERLAYLAASPDAEARLAAYARSPFHAAFNARMAARAARLKALLPPLPGLQSPGD